MLALLLVVVVVACFVILLACLFPTSSPRIDKRPKTETGLVQETKARWKDRRVISGGFFFDTEFQVWRGRIPEKSSKNTPFPLGGDCLEHRGGHPPRLRQDLRAADPNN